MKTSKFRVTGLCEGNSPVTGEFPAQMASDADNVVIWWRHHVDDFIETFICKGQYSHMKELLEANLTYSFTSYYKILQ